MTNTIQVKRGNNASLPTLAAGEFGFSTDTYQLHIGDGTSNHEVIMDQTFDAQTILAATTNNTPSALTISEGNIVGRKSGGNVAALGGADVMGVLSGTATAAFSMNSQKITSVTDPGSAQDAATKSYVDAIEQGLDTKDSVRVATQSNIADLSTGAPDPVDGISLSAGDRVLVKEQTTGSENGLYTVDTVGTGSNGEWSRTTDADEDAEVTSGLYCWVEEGTNSGDQGYIITTNDPITVGTTSITFTQFSGAGQITAGTNLSKSGNTLNVSPQGADSGLNADTLDGTQLSSIDWADVAMATGDVTKTDVSLGSVTNDAQIAKDGSIDFTGSQSMGDNDLTDINAGVFGEIATPANPSAGYNKLYFKSDDHLYALDDGGNETQVDTTGADEKVGIDSAATPGYIGVDGTSGVLRTGSSKLSYTDGGDYVTLDVSETNIDLSNCDNSTSAFISDITGEAFDSLSDVAAITEAQGQVIYYDGAAWNALDPGTSGQLLQTQGGAANPVWGGISSFLEDAPTDAETTKAPTSNWAYDHNVAATGVHGAGTNTLLHTASTIDGGSFT